MTPLEWHWFLLWLLQLGLMFSGFGLSYCKLQPNVLRRIAWTLWAIAAIGLVSAQFSSPVYSSSLREGTFLGLGWRDRWSEAVSWLSMMIMLLGLCRGTSPDRLFILGFGCAVAAGIRGTQCVLPLLCLTPYLFRPESTESSLSSSRSWTRTATVCGILTAAGCLLPNALATGSNPWIAAHQLEILRAILGLAGIGGLTGWFPFPVLSFTTESQRCPGDGRVLLLLACLTGLSLIVRITDRLCFETTLGVLVTAAVMPAIFCGFRLLRPESIDAFLRLRAFVGCSSLLAPICLIVWQNSLIFTNDWNREFWSKGNLLSGDVLLCWGVIVEWGSLLFLVLVNSCRQKLSSPETVGQQAAIRGRFWLGLALWISSGLPPSPVFWWRFQLLASLAVAHRQSTLTKLVEPHPLFLLLIMLLTFAWVLTAAGTLKLWLHLCCRIPVRGETEQLVSSSISTP